ncbi:MAG: hypothetical protein ACAI35_07935 [Candidatus Methylacidiphilales bacterium]|nr:hypothetical protein [Candidatus Methylacidiphilales bacterium]
MSHPNTANAEQWQSEARSLAMRLNINWWLSTFLPMVLGISIAFAILILLGRKQGLNTSVLWTIYGIMLMLGSVAAGYVARHKFISMDKALVRLEAVLGLKNRLSAASAGIGAWPAVPEQRGDGYSAHWKEIFWPLLVSALIILAALWVPLTPARAVAATPQEPPPIIADFQRRLEELSKEEVIAEQKLQETMKQASNLTDKPKEEWYNQSNLEAGDALQKMTDQALSDLTEEMKKAQSALAEMEKAPANTSEDKMQAIQDKLDKAVEAMNSGALPIHPKIAEQFKGMDANKVRSLTPEQMQKLKEKMKEAADKMAKACKDCNGGKDGQDGQNGQGDGGQGLADGAKNADQPGNRRQRPNQNGQDGTGDMQQGQGQGQDSGNGVSRGPGADPLSFYDNELRPGEARGEQVTAEDLNNADVDSKTGESKKKHNVDKNAFTGPSASGTTTHTGGGGDMVWRTSLTPDEDEVLKRFYK